MTGEGQPNDSRPRLSPRCDRDIPTNDPDRSLEIAVDQFTDALNRGECANIEEFAEKYPSIKGESLEVFRAVLKLRHHGNTAGALRGDAADSEDSAPSVSSDGLSGTALGPYRIGEVIGRGGMAIVYEAWHSQLNRKVALKVLSHSWGTKRWLRFQREGRAAARLHHTHIVPIFETGTIKGHHFIAMQLIEGWGLDVLFRRHLVQQSQATPTPRSENEPWPGDNDTVGEESATESSWLTEAQIGAMVHNDVQIARLAQQAAVALSHAHERGVLHRDIKPSNLLLDRKGDLWVTDFGLAKMDDEDLTETGDLLGTLRYLPPERFDRVADVRGDLYSLGLTVYELITRTRAFETDDEVNLLAQVQSSEPTPPRKVRPEIPRDLETIVLRSIARDPDRRYQSAAEFAEDLRRFREKLPIRARRMSVTQRLGLWAKRNPSVAALSTSVAVLMLTLFAGALFTAFYFRKLANDRELALAGRNETLIKNQNLLIDLQKSERIANERLFDANLNRAVAMIESGRIGQRVQSLAGLSEAAALVKKLGKSNDVKVKLRNAAIACLSQVDLAVEQSWDSDIPAAFSYDFTCFARWEKDGSFIICRTADNTLVRRLENFPPFHINAQILFSPRGDSLAVVNRSSVEVWDVKQGRCLHQFRVFNDRSLVAFDFSDDGQSFVFATPSGEIRIHEIGNSEADISFAVPRPPRLLSLSPSGKTVAMSPFGRSGTGVEIWSLETQKKIQTLGEDAGISVALAWSSDGDTLATGWSGQLEIRLFECATGQLIQTLRGHTGSVRNLSFVPESELLISQSWDGTSRLWHLQPAREVLRFIGEFAHLGADGRTFVNRTSQERQLGGASGQVCRLIIPGEHFVRRVDRDATKNVVPVDACSNDIWICMPTSNGIQWLSADSLESAAFMEIGPCKAVFFVEDGNSLVTAGNSGVWKWPIDFMKAGGFQVGPPELLTMEPFDSSSQSVAVAADASRVILAEASRQQAQVIDLRASDPPALLKHGGIRWVTMSRDGELAATGCWHAPELRVWDARTGAHIRSLWSDTVTTMPCISPDGQLLVAWTPDEYRVWSTSSWEQLAVFPRHHGADRMGRMAFSPDSRVLALGMGRNEIHLINVETHQRFAALQTQYSDFPTGKLTFSDSGRRLIASHEDFHEIWDLQTIGQSLSQIHLGWEDNLFHDSTSSSRQHKRADNVVIVRGCFDEFINGHELIRKKDWFRASVALTAALNHDNAPASAYKSRALAFRSMELWPPARDDLTKLIEDHSGSAQAWYDRGFLEFERAFYTSGSPDGLEDIKGDMQKTLELDGTFHAARYPLAVAHWFLGETHEAITQLEICVREQVNSGESWKLLGEAHEKIGEYDEARRCFEQATRFPSLRSSAFMSLSLISLRQGDQQKALEEMNRCLSDRARPPVYAPWVLQRYLEYWKSVVRNYPESPVAWMGQAVMHAHLKKWADTLNDCQKALEIHQEPAEPIDGQVLFLDLDHERSHPHDSSLDDNKLNTLAGLSQGEQRLDGIPFLIGPQILLLRHNGGSRELPGEVLGINVNTKLTRFHFLHNSIGPEQDGVAIARYRIHYQDGHSEDYDIIQGEHLFDANYFYLGKPTIAWIGTNEHSVRTNRTISLCRSTWKNPHPNRTIKSIDFLSLNTRAGAFCVAITGESSPE